MVFWLEPLRRTLEPETKLDPLTVRVKFWTVFQNRCRTQRAYEGTRVIRWLKWTDGEVSAVPTTRLIQKRYLSGCLRWQCRQR